jgi:hypothetical protein
LEAEFTGENNPLAVTFPHWKDFTLITGQEIAGLRLLNQRIALPSFKEPGEVVDWLGAVQAQDYFGAKWALGLRMRDATDRKIDKAFNEGSILRTHVLRPTWHFVRPADIRWMLALTAPRVHAVNAYMYRQQGLDDSTFERSNATLAKALEGGGQLTRDELRDVLQDAGIGTDPGLRMSYLMMHAELEGLICSGPRRGKQFTYALLEERAPQAITLKREEALAELVRRFFISRGPATAQDFAKWSGLTLADARNGLEAVKGGLEHEAVDDQEYWFLRPRAPIQATSPTAYLLSVYDEYISGYKDRSAMDGNNLGDLFSAMGNALQYVIVLDGQLVGTWKRTIRKDAVVIQTNLLAKLSEAQYQAVAQAAQQYGAFLELPVVIEIGRV